MTTTLTVENKIEVFQNKIRKMVQERKKTEETSVPSEYWRSYIEKFKHLIYGKDLGPFETLRHLTYHITGAKPGDHPRDNEIVKRSFRRLSVPSWVFNVVQEPRQLGGFGVDINGRLINRDICRYLTVFSTLFRAHVATPADPLRVLEIGGGWGGLAHHFRHVFPRSTYVIVDLPETMIYSSVYLSKLNSTAKIYMYDTDDYPNEINDEFLNQYDYAFFPNWKINTLPDQYFDLAINIASLQEMTIPQVNNYLDEIKRVCRGFFYSQNKRNYANKELEDVHPLILKKYDMVYYKTTGPIDWLAPIKRALKKCFMKEPGWSPMENPEDVWNSGKGYRDFLCTPKK